MSPAILSKQESLYKDVGRGLGSQVSKTEFISNMIILTIGFFVMSSDNSQVVTCCCCSGGGSLGTLKRMTLNLDRIIILHFCSDMKIVLIGPSLIELAPSRSN